MATDTSPYFAEIKKIAVLSRNQQLQFGRAVREWLDWPEGADNAPDQVRRKGMRARKRMVETNLRLVLKIANKYEGQGLSLMDLVQEGSLGLIAAVEKFEPVRGYCFTTCAYWWIRQSMTRALANTSRTIRVPCNASELGRKIRVAEMECLRANGRLPSPVEIADFLGEKLSRVEAAIQAVHVQPSSLDQLEIDYLPVGVGVWDGCDDGDATEGDIEALHGYIAALPNLERMTIEGVVFESLTKREVADRLSLSTTRVGQLYRSAEARLRQMAGTAPQHPSREVKALTNDPVSVTVIPEAQSNEPGVAPAVRGRFVNQPILA